MTILLYRFTKLPNGHQPTMSKWHQQNIDQNQCYRQNKRWATIKLAQRGLKINESKTEEYTIKKVLIWKNCGNLWRDCKLLLGSLLDTQNDIKKRKVLAINAAYKLKHLFLNKDVTISVKTKFFKSYITLIFLYNSEL